jgi:hypothetical protein
MPETSTAQPHSGSAAAAAASARAQPSEDKEKTMAPTTRKIKGYGWRPDRPEFASRDSLRTYWKVILR